MVITIYWERRVVMADELTTVLGDYVTSDGLAEERGLIVAY